MRRNIPPVLMLIVVFFLPVKAGAARPKGGFAATEDEVVREIVDLEHQAKDAALHRDAAFVERTLADDYVAITQLGQIVTKADTVAARKTAQLRYDTIEISDMVVRLYGNTAIVTARANVKGTELGEEFSGPYRFTRVWVRRNGKWLTVSYQATVTR